MLRGFVAETFVAKTTAPALPQLDHPSLSAIPVVTLACSRPPPRSPRSSKSEGSGQFKFSELPCSCAGPVWGCVPSGRQLGQCLLRGVGARDSGGARRRQPLPFQSSSMLSSSSPSSSSGSVVDPWTAPEVRLGQNFEGSSAVATRTPQDAQRGPETCRNLDPREVDDKSTKCRRQVEHRQKSREEENEERERPPQGNICLGSDLHVAWTPEWLRTAKTRKAFRRSTLGEKPTKTRRLWMKDRG